MTEVQEHDGRSQALGPVAPFARAGEPADVAVVVVTYRNAGHVDRLVASLRAENREQRLRVVVADNASDDGTLDAVRAHDDVVAVDSGGNLGYAGGINVAMAHVGDVSAVLVLNPDLEIRPGCIAALRARMERTGAGAVVPRILEPDGSTYPSLRHEPSLLRALGDAVFGAHLPARPPVLSEMVFDPAEYDRAGTVDWATGAAVLVDRSVADAVGPWDERFFLYSEETDYFRRIREAGYSVWYESDAVVRHDQGGSGQSVELQKLMGVNRVRYARKHGGRLFGALYRGVVVMHEGARSYLPDHREVFRTVISERSWPSLPNAQVQAQAQSSTPPGTDSVGVARGAQP